MTNKGKKPRLVAENRYPKTGREKSAKKKTATKRKRRPSRKSVETYLHDLFLGSFVCCHGFVACFLAWRLAIAIMLAIGIGYYMQDLKPYEELLDGRAKGSVTLLDRSGAVFAWRGEQFGGSSPPIPCPPFEKRHHRDRGSSVLSTFWNFATRPCQCNPHQPARRTWPIIGTRRINTNPTNRKIAVYGDGI